MRSLLLASFTCVVRLTLPVVLVSAVQADVQLARPFGDHMVLQCEAKLPVWGTATPGEAVTVEFAGQKKRGTASADGHWRVDLDPVAASAKPALLLVSGSSMAHPLRIQDVLVGEVWVCAGEANMERPLGPRPGLKPITDGEAEVANAKYPTIRQLTVKPQATAATEVSWKVCSPETAGDFSAVAYFFARDLQHKIGTPIGILHAAAIESPIEAWTSAAGLPDRARPSSGEQKASSPFGPSSLYDGMIAPLLPYAIRGVALYHGESNSERAEDYRRALTAVIADWRARWGQGDFPFLFVQAAPCLALRPELREAQLLTWQSTKNTAMVVTLDCGDPEALVPPRKQPVGARLALAARALAYHENVEFSGPVFERMTVEEDRAVLHFTHLGGGLAANDFALMTFTMAGPDGIFHAAHGEVEGETIWVSIPDVEKPMAVRYAWEKAPEGNVVNDAGLPASPFRTDHD